MLYAHTHAHTTAQTDTLAYAIKDTSLQVLVKRSALGACSMQNLEDPEIHSKGGQWVYTGTFWPRAQSQHSRSLLVSDCKAFVEGSQSRAEELEVLCPVAGPTGAPVSSPIFKAEFKTGFERVVLQTVFLVTGLQIEVRVFFLAHSLQLPTCANAFCSH